jgi:hypothetical protein
MNIQFARLFGTFPLASNIPLAAIQRQGFPTLPLGLQVYPPLVFPLGIILRENVADLRIPEKHYRLEIPITPDIMTFWIEMHKETAAVDRTDALIVRIPRKHLKTSERPKANEATSEIFVHVDSV